MTIDFINIGKLIMKKFVNIVTVLVMVIGNIITPFANATGEVQEIYSQETTQTESGNDFDLNGTNSDNWDSPDLTEWEGIEAWKENNVSENPQSKLPEVGKWDGDAGTWTTENKSWTDLPETNTWDNNDITWSAENETWADTPKIDTWDTNDSAWTEKSGTRGVTSEEESLESIATRLWIDRETQAVYYAVLAWISVRDYEWTAEQDEIIRTYLLDHEDEISEGSNPKYPRWLTRNFNDIVYTWVVRWKLFTITLMDRNLWAKETWAWAGASTDSYGYYYQWWNNFPFHFDTNLNDINSTKVDTLGFWPGNRFYWNKFIKWNDGDGDWSDEWNNNLWWWAWDNQGNNYWEDGTDRQWPCPEWYYIPSAKEWHELLEVFLANNDVEAISNNWKTYPDFVGDEWWAAYEPDEQIIA